MDKLSAIQQPITEELNRLNLILRQTLQTSSPLMNEVVERYLSSKGKQIRPILVLLCAKIFGDILPESIYAAAAIELLHNASLIHDDVVDESAMRRGKPTINHIYDNRISVLVGDYFVSCSLKEAIRTGHIEIINCIGTLGQELARGEIDQLSNARNHLLNEDAYLEVISRKTASLFYACMKVGAVSAHADEETARILTRYGELLGLCFQIKDDIFDYFEDKAIGKPTGNDLREGKATLPIIHAITTHPGEESDRMRALLNQPELSNADIEQLIEYAKTNGGIEYAYTKMQELRNEAVALLSELPASPTIDALTAILDYTIERNK